MSDSHADRKAIHRIEIGRIQAVIWTTRGSTGDVEHSVKLERLTDCRPGVCRPGGWLGRDDLLVASKVLQLAHAYICKLERRQRATPE